MEHRVLVEARQAAPDDIGFAVHERGDAAIADNAKIKIAHDYFLFFR